MELEFGPVKIFTSDSFDFDVSMTCFDFSHAPYGIPARLISSSAKVFGIVGGAKVSIDGVGVPEGEGVGLVALLGLGADVGKGVGLGFRDGAEEGEGTVDVAGLGLNEGAATLITTPLSQTSFFPLFMQVNFLP